MGRLSYEVVRIMCCVSISVDFSFLSFLQLTLLIIMISEYHLIRYRINKAQENLSIDNWNFDDWNFDF